MLADRLAVGLSAQLSSKWYVDASNAASVDGYTLLNARLAYRLPLRGIAPEVAFAVLDAYQGRGIGKALMKEIERYATDAHKLYVCTMLRTPRNISLFLNLGYRPEAVLPDHYHRMDMICFSKFLKPPP